MTTSMEKVAIFGAGGFGREVAWLAQSLDEAVGGLEVVCFIEDDPALQGQTVNDIPVYDLQSAHRRFPGAKVVAGIGSPRARQSAMEKAAETGFSFATLIGRRVQRSRWTEIGDGTVICAGNILTTNIVLGKHVQINLDCTVGHDVVMDDYVTVAPGVHVSGYVHFGKRVYVGTGAVIINGTQDDPLIIDDDVVVGAGACVTRSIAAGLTVVGVPAKPL